MGIGARMRQMETRHTQTPCDLGEAPPPPFDSVDFVSLSMVGGLLYSTSCVVCGACVVKDWFGSLTLESRVRVENTNYDQSCVRVRVRVLWLGCRV